MTANRYGIIPTRMERICFIPSVMMARTMAATRQTPPVAVPIFTGKTPVPATGSGRSLPHLPRFNFFTIIRQSDCAAVFFSYNHRLMHQIIQSLSDWYNHALQTGVYPAIALMMAVESSLFPLPSEIVIPPAAHWAHTGQIPLSLWGIVLAGTIGSWFGATLMYWTARIAGRPLVLRFGKYFFISAQKVEGAERWSAHYGAMGIFISRLLPVVRHLIGIPAGIVRMD